MTKVKQKAEMPPPASRPVVDERAVTVPAEATAIAVQESADNLDWIMESTGTGALEAGQPPRVLGTMLKFVGSTTSGEWLAGGVPCTGRELVVVDKMHQLIRWGANQQRVSCETVPRGAPRPDLAALNEGVPKAEWRVNLNGAPEGPFQLQAVLLFLDLSNETGTVESLWWPTNISVKGSMRAMDDLAADVARTRRAHGTIASPVVNLTFTFMPTAFGGRMRPKLAIVDWARRTEHGIERGIAPVLPSANDNTIAR